MCHKQAKVGVEDSLQLVMRGREQMDRVRSGLEVVLLDKDRSGSPQWAKLTLLWDRLVDRECKLGLPGVQLELEVVLQDKDGLAQIWDSWVAREFKLDWPGALLELGEVLLDMDKSALLWDR